MDKQKIEHLLNKMAEKSSGPVPKGLCQNIKEHIPQNLYSSKRGVDTVNIMIDLRINKLAAAAIIILALIFTARIFSTATVNDSGLYSDSKMVVNYLLGNGEKKDVIGKITDLYKELKSQGKEVHYYGEVTKPGDSKALLMHWKVSDTTYRAVFGDLKTKTISAEELINIQAAMLEKKEAY